MSKTWILIPLLFLVGCAKEIIYIDTPFIGPKESWIQPCTVVRPPLDWGHLSDADKVDLLTVKLITQMKHTTNCNARLKAIRTWKEENK